MSSGGKGTDIIVFSESDDLSRPLAMLLMKPGDGVHGQPLLSGMLVDSAHRRKGLATKLITKAEASAREIGAKSLFAVTHPNNQPVREMMGKMGYTEMILLEKKLCSQFANDEMDQWGAT